MDRIWKHRDVSQHFWKSPTNDSQEARHPQNHFNMGIDLNTLQGFYNREQAAVEYSRVQARYGNHLLSQLNFWKQAFTNLQAAYVQLQTDHTALLTRYELAVSHNIDAGPIIMENMALKRRLASIESDGQVQNESIPTDQVGSIAEGSDGKLWMLADLFKY